MSKRFTYWGSKQSILTWSGVFGANYYDHWRAWDAASLTLTGALVDSAASLTGSGRDMVSTGGNRPSVIADATLGLNVFDFDGISEFMHVLSSTSSYNFLHNGSGGCVIVIYRSTLGTSTSGRILTNYLVASSDAGFIITKNPSNKDAQAVTDGSTGVIAVNTNTDTVGTTQVHSSISVFDQNNATTSDKLYNIFDSASQKNNTTTGTPSVSNASYNLHLGVLVNQTQRFFKGQIAEVIVLDTIPTPTQLTQIQTILSQDYATFPI